MPSARWMTWSASADHSLSTVPRTMSSIRQTPVARHPEPHGGGPSLGFEARPVGIRLGRPAAARDIGALRGLGLGALGLSLLGPRIVAVGEAAREELLDRGLVERQTLGLVVGGVRTADLGALVPVDPQPAEAVEDRRQRVGEVPLRVGVVDPQDELPAVVAREEPVEERRAHPADVQVAGGRGGEADAGSCRRRSGEGHGRALFRAWSPLDVLIAIAVGRSSENWRRGRDSNPRYRLTPYDGLANRCLKPLGHLSARQTRPADLTGLRRVESKISRAAATLACSGSCPARFPWVLALKKRAPRPWEPSVQPPLVGTAEREAPSCSRSACQRGNS